jgi:hypothetical protein
MTPLLLTQRQIGRSNLSRRYRNALTMRHAFAALRGQSGDFIHLEMPTYQFNAGGTFVAGKENSNFLHALSGQLLKLSRILFQKIALQNVLRRTYHGLAGHPLCGGKIFGQLHVHDPYDDA